MATCEGGQKLLEDSHTDMESREKFVATLRSKASSLARKVVSFT